jgi:mRNA interferase RelE/StbE
MSPAYALELSPAARRDLKRLPREIQRKIAFEHLPAIQREPLKAGKPLTGVLKNERSYHFGRKPEYRIIYFVEGSLVLVTIIGARENLYRRARQRKR